MSVTDAVQPATDDADNITVGAAVGAAVGLVVTLGAHAQRGCPVCVCVSLIC